MIKNRLQIYQISTNYLIIQEIIEVRDNNDNLSYFDINSTYCSNIDNINNNLITYQNNKIVRIFNLSKYYEVKDERPIK